LALDADTVEGRCRGAHPPSNCKADTVPPSNRKADTVAHAWRTHSNATAHVLRVASYLSRPFCHALLVTSHMPGASTARRRRTFCVSRPTCHILFVTSYLSRRACLAHPQQGDGGTHACAAWYMRCMGDACACAAANSPHASPQAGSPPWRDGRGWRRPWRDGCGWRRVAALRLAHTPCRMCGSAHAVLRVRQLTRRAACAAAHTPCPRHVPLVTSYPHPNDHTHSVP
jgi:hypothetical protein